MRRAVRMTLAEQVADAQRVVASWTDEKRRSVQLEGYDYRKQPNVIYTPDLSDNLGREQG